MREQGYLQAEPGGERHDIEYERRRVTLEEFEEMCRRLSEYTRVHGVKGLVATVDEEREDA